MPSSSAAVESAYAPRIDQVRRTKRILFVEGTTDLSILKELAGAIGVEWPEDWVEWRTTASHKERKLIWKALSEDIPGIIAFSLRDRDDEPLGTVADDLTDMNCKDAEGFYPRKWRRRYIEAYLLWPPALAAVSNRTQDQVVEYLKDLHGIAIGATFVDKDAPQSLLDVRAKHILCDLGVNAIDIAKALPPSAVCHDVKILIKQLVHLQSDQLEVD